jgi:prepilin-type processing-associated H-X9-DG protein
VGQAGVTSGNPPRDYFIVPSPEFASLPADVELLTVNFGSSHSGGRCQFVFCDGSVLALQPSVDGITLAALANIADGTVMSALE